MGVCHLQACIELSGPINLLKWFCSTNRKDQLFKYAFNHKLILDLNEFLKKIN